MAAAAAPPMSAGPPQPHAAASLVSNPPPSSVRVVPRSTPLMSLPPHRRAQVILEEMAGLTSRLAELGGNKTWQGVSGKAPVHTFLPGATITPEAAAATTTKELLSMIEAHQELLFEAIEEITKLQEIEQEKQRIAELIASRDSVMREFAKRLRDAEQVLEYTLEDHEDYWRPKRRGDACASEGVVGLGTIDVKELVAYAHRISYTTFAPPEYATGQVALRGALPPAPQEEQLRASQLYHAAEMDLGLPKPSISTASPSTPADAHLETNKLKAESPQMSSTLRLPAGVPLPPPIPPGWRPGMPIELPTDLPPMPPGWKPGDPIPLPPGLEIPSVPPGWKPGDAVMLPSSVAASKPLDQGTPKPAPAPLAVPTAQPGVIQVPFVQLDLNPELEEDYGSDYSDEDGSSEEDED